LTQSSSNNRVLIVDDEAEICSTLASVLRREGYSVDTASGRYEAHAYCQAISYDLVITDIVLAGESGIELLKDIKNISASTQVVIFTGNPEVDTSTEALRNNAFDYLIKPVRRETLIAVTRHAISAKKLIDENEKYRADLEAIFHSVSDSIVMVDNDGKLVRFNAAAEDACGYCSNKLGMDISSIDVGCNRLCNAPLLEVLQTKKPNKISRVECHPTGGPVRIVSLTATPIIGSDGSVNGAVIVVRDETRLVDLERSLRRRDQIHHTIIGSSEPMQQIYSMIEVLAGVSTTVLITGESGTGKELVAAALHSCGPRVKKPFIKLNCSALSEALLESELFGHVRGAFTGAIADKIGRFQKADGGTLFLDEIGDISPAVQMRLLRVLQESEFERVGESTPIKVDVRIIAATNQNLEESVHRGSFRKDLYYRLNVVCLRLPTLRERIGDLGTLVAHFLGKFNSKFFKNIVAVSDDAMAILVAHDWPGNIRELEHTIEHATLLCQTDCIAVSNLPNNLMAENRVGVKPAILPASLQPASTLTITEALEIAGGNKSEAARLLGVCRSTIYRHIAS